MSRLSVKLKVTLWYTIFMLVLVGAMLVFIFSISDSVMRSATRNGLMNAVEKSFAEIEFDDGQLEVDDDLNYIANGIYLSIYNDEGQLLFGKIPSGFETDKVFEDDKLSTLGSGNKQWYIYDMTRQVKGYGQIWVRGIASISEAEEAMKTMLTLTQIALPFIVLITAVGGYWITRRAFLPVTKITAAAKEIGDGKDLTKRIRLGDGKDEIHTLSNTFDKMFDRLQESFDAEKQFTSDASHELRTPTAVILSQCEYALQNAETVEETKETLEVIQSQAKKMSKLISQLLTLARNDQANQKLELELVNVSEIMEMVVEEQELFAKEKQISIQTQIEPDVIMQADQTLLMRLFINLIANGIAYGNENGHIFIRLEKTQTGIHGMIGDDGIGIAAEHLDKIWNRFYQVDYSRTTKLESGSGLGLSMVKWIVEAHHGEIWVRSQLGKGSMFEFDFPQGE